jgi:hypothetical protein
MLGVWPPGALLATLFFFNNAYGPYKVPSPDIHSYTIILTSFIIMLPTSLHVLVWDVRVFMCQKWPPSSPRCSFLKPRISVSLLCGRGCTAASERIDTSPTPQVRHYIY